MILSCNKITKSFVVEELLKDVSFIINEKEKVALIGINGGAGKTTLFRIITGGELLADSGDILIGKVKALAISNKTPYQPLNFHSTMRFIMQMKH